MIHYKISTTHFPHRHFIAFEARIPTHGNSLLHLQLPAWRPGRYELGNFSKNIRAWQSFNAKNEKIYFEKLNKDLWQVNCAGLDEVIIRYEYYSAELNAGSTFLDEELLYINPVNCFFYNADNVNENYELHFDLKQEIEIACGLKKKSKHILVADNFDQLADCPLIASANVNHLSYRVNDVDYHLHIQGEVKLDEARLLREFEAFTNTQIAIFGDIPCGEYHFLFHFLPYFVRHGVEHHNSTVIAMGPAADFQNDALFKDLLGISCHELFHTWNIKNIRPFDMMPYDFTEENYSRLGYVCEGVTTYYGDMLLWRSGAFNDAEWCDVLSDSIQTYLDNPGRFNHSVADSSFDTWLDGYGAGIPWRKISIYNEGLLIAFICDIHIRLLSQNKFSLDTVMKNLYEKFGKQNIGYTEQDYLQLINEAAGADMSDMFSKIVHGNGDYMPYLLHCLDALGMEITEAPNPKWNEAYLGLFVDENVTKAVVQSVMPSSPADLAGLWLGDEIVAINNVAPYKNFQHLMRMHENDVQVSYMRKGKLRNTLIRFDGSVWANKYRVAMKESTSDEALLLRNNWKNGQAAN
jgi:predicted metalloprotease with PDZ domain